MNRQRRPLTVPPRQRGFTLIELVVTLVVFSILATMMMHFLQTSFSNSVLPATRLQLSMNLQTVMENMRADYNKNRDLALLKGNIGTGDQDNLYGVYTVVTNRFIKFTANTEDIGLFSDRTLKVTIQDPITGQIMTSLFVDW